MMKNLVAVALVIVVAQAAIKEDIVTKVPVHDI